MLITDFVENQRKAVIELFENCKKQFHELGECEDKEIAGLNSKLELLTDEIKNLKSNRYVLAVAGEAKSGKSTFINGLLGEPILPTGILQCTSSVIEITDTGADTGADISSEPNRGKIYLIVEYGDDEKKNETFQLEDGIAALQKKLEEVAALDENWRPLPFIQLNDWLIDNKPKEISASGVDELIKSFDLENSDPKVKEKNRNKYNPKNLSDDEFRSKIQEYLEVHKDLSKIVKKVSMGYPFGFKSTDLKIVDTPGVNAVGGLAEVSHEYLKEANAIIFIHPHNNIESQSFREAFNNYLPDHLQIQAFLFINRFVELRQQDIDALLETARRGFPKVLPERILVINSLLKKIYDLLAKGVLPEEIRNEQQLTPLMSTYILDKNDGKITDLQEPILKDSNFQAVREVLTNFAEGILSERLSKVVEEVKFVCGEHLKIYGNEISTLRSKLEKSPKEFDEQIQIFQDKLETYMKNLDDFLLKNREDYVGNDTESKRRFLDLRDKYIRLVEQSSDKDEVIKHYDDFIFDCNQEVSSIAKELAQKIDGRVKSLVDAEEALRLPEVKIKTVTFEKEAALEPSSWDKIRRVLVRGSRAAVSSLVENFTDLFTGAKTLDHVVIEAAKAAANEALPDLNDVKEDTKVFIRNGVGKVISSLSAAYREATGPAMEELRGIVNLRKTKLEDLNNRKQVAEQLTNEINSYEGKCQQVSDILQSAESIERALQELQTRG
ncbi:MAG TPA: dynamin family protein [Trichocoleus sp.]|jgi:hypothetical protein